MREVQVVDDRLAAQADFVLALALVLAFAFGRILACALRRDVAGDLTRADIDDWLVLPEVRDEVLVVDDLVVLASGGSVTSLHILRFRSSTISALRPASLAPVYRA
ncbi:MAG: hypothetical protein WBV77_17390 [Solirubrobacteraceae bacterium]